MTCAAVSLSPQVGEGKFGTLALFRKAASPILPVRICVTTELSTFISPTWSLGALRHSGLTPTSPHSGLLASHLCFLRSYTNRASGSSPWPWGSLVGTRPPPTGSASPSRWRFCSAAASSLTCLVILISLIKLDHNWNLWQCYSRTRFQIIILISTNNVRLF